MEFKNHIEKNYLLKEIDEKQQVLSKKYLEPKLQFLEDKFLSIRNQLDVAIQLKKQGKSQNDLIDRLIDKYFMKTNRYVQSNYPIGSCYPITHLIFEYLNLEIQNNDEWSFLREFISKGGVFKKIWGQRDDIVFQTATQLGIYYLDIANDTVDVFKPKLELKLMKDSRFKNIDTIEEYVRVMQLYQHNEAIPNYAYPNLFPFFPFFTISHGGYIVFKNNPYLTYLIFESKGTLINQYLQEIDTLKHSIYYNEISRFFRVIGANKSLQNLLEYEEFNTNNTRWNSIHFNSDFILNYNLSKSISKLYALSSK